jgi:hypothetical protein
LPDLREVGDASQRCFEFIDEEVLVISILTPPPVFGLKLGPGFIE